jgi:hypothetical protein
MQTALGISDDVDDNESCVLTIKINGRTRKMNRSWMVDSGRVVGSALAKQILGADEALQGSTEIRVPGVPNSDFDVAFDQLCAWLGAKHGDAAFDQRCEWHRAGLGTWKQLGGNDGGDVYKTLTLQNCPALFNMASYFCLPLEEDVKREWSNLIRAELRPLVSKIEEWRRFHEEVHSVFGDDGHDGRC